MQISSESFINVLTEQVKNLTIENAQLRALILDSESKAQGANEDKSNNEHD